MTVPRAFSVKCFRMAPCFSQEQPERQLLMISLCVNVLGNFLAISDMCLPCQLVSLHVNFLFSGTSAVDLPCIFSYGGCGVVIAMSGVGYEKKYILESWYDICTRCPRMEKYSPEPDDMCLELVCGENLRCQ